MCAMHNERVITTEVLPVDPQHPQPERIRQAARIIQEGGLVAFPTETVYGLGADALNAEAVRSIFTAKGRPAYDPIIVHVDERVISDPDLLTDVVTHVSSTASLLVRTFWPGALTLVLPKSDRVPDVVTADGPTVAIRCPGHPVAQALIRAAGCPIAAPSANRFSHTSPTTAQHVLDDLDGRLALILDGGPTSIGVESTVLDLSGDRPRLLRPGGVSLEALEAVLGPVEQRGDPSREGRASCLAGDARPPLCADGRAFALHWSQRPGPNCNAKTGRDRAIGRTQSRADGGGRRRGRTLDARLSAGLRRSAGRCRDRRPQPLRRHAFAGRRRRRSDLGRGITRRKGWGWPFGIVCAARPSESCRSMTLLLKTADDRR